MWRIRYNRYMAKMLTAGEVARELGVQPVTVRKWASDGIIPCTRTAGGHRRFTLAEVRKAVGALGGDADVVLSVLQTAISSAAVKPLHVSIFGSVARGTEGPGSDVDLLVVHPAFASESERTEFGKLMVEMVFSIDRAVDRDLQILRLSQERLGRLALAGSTLLADVIGEGRTVWGPSLRDILAPIVLAAGSS